MLLDARFVTDSKIVKWLLPTDFDKIKASVGNVIYNSLDMLPPLSRQTMTVFFDAFKERTANFKVKSSKVGYIGVMTYPIPCGMGVDILYKQGTHKDSTLELYQYVFHCIGDTPCIMTKQRNNLSIDFDIRGNHHHMVWRKIDNAKVKDPMRFVQACKQATVSSIDMLSGYHELSKLLVENTKGVLE